VNQGIVTVREQTGALRKLDINAVDERSNKVLTKAIEKIMNRATGAGQSVKVALDEIKNSIAAGKKKGAPGMQARSNLYNSAAKDFHGPQPFDIQIIVFAIIYYCSCVSVCASMGV
jgi:hypothetical protein